MRNSRNNLKTRKNKPGSEEKQYEVKTKKSRKEKKIKKKVKKEQNGRQKEGKELNKNK